MDNAAAALVAVALAGMVASLLQERLAGRVNGSAAVALNVAASLVIGIIAVYRVGGLAIGLPAGADTFSTVVEILKIAIGIALASKAAFEVITKPLSK